MQQNNFSAFDSGYGAGEATQSNVQSQSASAQAYKKEYEAGVAQRLPAILNELGQRPPTSSATTRLQEFVYDRFVRKADADDTVRSDLCGHHRRCRHIARCRKTKGHQRPAAGRACDLYFPVMKLDKFFD